MKRIIISILFVLFAVSNVVGQAIDFKFDKRGRFKIIQITDTHFIYGNPESDVVIKLLEEVIDAEKPDLLVFTGDMVWGNKDTKKALDALFAPVIERKVPWAYVFGNHDDEAEMSRKDIMNYVTKMPYCVAKSGDEFLHGVGNYVIEVKDRKGRVASALYCLDSNAYSQIEEIEGYAWFERDQIEWYRKQSASYTKQNGGIPMPSVAFFHIPLCEYGELSSDPANYIGEKKESGGQSKLNSGMFTAMRASGDIMATFVGHDHDNDFIGLWHGICLTYGRFSGGNTVYNNLGKNGCRIIELHERSRVFDTSVYLLGGEKLYKVRYPRDFVKK